MKKIVNVNPPIGKTKMSAICLDAFNWSIADDLSAQPDGLCLTAQHFFGDLATLWQYLSCAEYGMMRIKTGYPKLSESDGKKIASEVNIFLTKELGTTSCILNGTAENQFRQLDSHFKTRIDKEKIYRAISHPNLTVIRSVANQAKKPVRKQIKKATSK